MALYVVGRGGMRVRSYQMVDALRFGTVALPVQLAENALDVAKRVAPVIVGPIAAAVVQRALDDETAPDLETVMRAETPVQGRKAVCDAAQIDVAAVLPDMAEGGGAILAGEGGRLACEARIKFLARLTVEKLI